METWDNMRQDLVISRLTFESTGFVFLSTREFLHLKCHDLAALLYRRSGIILYQYPVLLLHTDCTNICGRATCSWWLSVFEHLLDLHLKSWTVRAASAKPPRVFISFFMITQNSRGLMWLGSRGNLKVKSAEVRNARGQNCARPFWIRKSW